MRDCVVANPYIFRNVCGYDGRYAITRDGQVYGVKRGRYIKQQRDHNGYLKVVIRKDGKRYNNSIHRLVAEAWLPNPQGLPQVNHIDGNKENNNVSNLEWCSSSYNVRHAVRTGLRKPLLGEAHPNRKLTSKEVLEIRKWSVEGQENQGEIAQRYGISQALVSNICRGLAWKHI